MKFEGLENKRIRTVWVNSAGYLLQLCKSVYFNQFFNLLCIQTVSDVGPLQTIRWKKHFVAGLRITVFFKQPTWVFVKKKQFLGFYKNEQAFVLFLRKMEKTHSELFFSHHAISPFSELHLHDLLYLLWHLKLRVKNVPIFFSQSVVDYCSLHSGKRLGKHAHSKQKNTLPHNLCSFTSSLYACPTSSASIVYFFNIWFGTDQHQKKFRCREGRQSSQNIVFFQHMIRHGPTSDV